MSRRYPPPEDSIYDDSMVASATVLPDSERCEGKETYEEDGFQNSPIEGFPSRWPQAQWTFKARHVEMMALGILDQINDVAQYLGSCIGAGIFLGTGPALYNSGPISLCLGYLFVGTVVYAVSVRRYFYLTEFTDFSGRNDRITPLTWWYHLVIDSCSGSSYSETRFYKHLTHLGFCLRMDVLVYVRPA